MGKTKKRPVSSSPQPATAGRAGKGSGAAPSSAGTSASATTGKLTQAEEQFARLVALGMSQIEAYRRASGSKAKDESAYVSGHEWAAKTRLRIEELRVAAKAKATEKYVYEYEDAMREADEALAFAREAGDSKAITAAVALKAKLSGLETEARRNDRAPFEGVSDEELVEGMNRDLSEAGYTLQ